MQVVKPLPKDPLKGLNKPRFGIDEQGRTVVYKTNSRQGRSEEEADNLDDAEVLFSHLFVDELQLDGVVTDEARLDGTDQVVLTSAFLENHRTLKEAGAGAVRNPDSAVAQVIAREFLGDGDAHAKNFIVGPRGNLKSIDFGIAGSAFPIDWRRDAFHEVMNNLSTTDNVTRFVTRIESLSDENIENMVDRAGAHLSDPNPELERTFVDNLIRNRDFIREQRPYAMYINESEPAVH